ncbi:MAG: RES domain-containing protein [Bdellovibrio sp.]|nr:RES domain-containing protein [Bdellovibrio sp.]
MSGLSLDSVNERTVLERVRCLRSLDGARSSKDEINATVIRCLDGYIAITNSLTLHTTETSRTSRARKVDGAIIESAKEIWIPPKQKLGRCNFPGERVLYLSGDPMTCLIELDARKGEHYWIGQFIYDPAKNLQEKITFKALGVINEIGFMKSFARVPFTKMLDLPFGKRGKKNTEIITKALADLFKQPVSDHDRHKYVITSSVCSYFWDDPLNFKKIEAIFYPSIKVNDLESGHINIAIREEAALRHVTLNKVRRVKVVNSYYEYDVVDESREILDCGRIVW